MIPDELRPYLRFPDDVLRGHTVDLLFGGGEVFGAMLEAIASARREILFESFTFKDGEAARRFIEALTERAAAGVHVRLLVDAAGSNELSQASRERLRAGGVELAEFHPLEPWRAGWSWRVRDHRKLLVIDGEQAFVGGTNVGDEYAPESWGGLGWHDVHLRVRGPAVPVLRRLFASGWKVARPDEDAPLPELSPSLEQGEAWIEVLALGGRRDRMAIRRQLHYAVEAARHTVRIQAAYFIPDLGWRRLLSRAAKRGVDVQVMVPGETDQQVVKWASRASFPRLLRAGVRLFEWGGPMLHAKTFSVDGRLAVVGSYNLDRWSLRHNWELMLAVADAPTATALERRFAEDLKTCHEVTLDEVKQTSWIKNHLASLSYTLRAWL